jgi:hypothetical protein
MNTLPYKNPLLGRISYSLDLPENPQRLFPTSVTSKHNAPPRCWARWAREAPVIGHNHLDPPPVSKDGISPEKRREITSKSGKLAQNRTGIRKGFGGRKEAQHALDRAKFNEGMKIVKIMAEKGMIDKDAAGNEALGYAIGVVRTEEIPASARLQAAKLVLEYTLAKPVNKQEIVMRAEDFLAELAEEAKARDKDEE